MVPPTVPSGGGTVAEQLGERAPMIMGGAETLLPGQAAQELEDGTLPGQAAAAVDVSSDRDLVTRPNASEPREPTTTDEAMSNELETVVVVQKEAQGSWGGWQEGDLCAVCQATCSDTPLNCGHALHPQCLAEWTLSNAEQRGNCPTCRKPLATRPRSPDERARTPEILSSQANGLSESDLHAGHAAVAPEQTVEIAATQSIDVRQVVRNTLRIAALLALVTISMLAIFTCALSGDSCCSVACDGGRAARYRYSNGTCVCADAGRSQPSPKCERWRYPGQRLLRPADSDARCAALALSNRLVVPPGSLLGGQRYLIITTVGATCASVGLQSVNDTLACESILRAANNDYSQDCGLGNKELTQVRRGLGENVFRYLYHVEGGQMFNREDAAPGSRRTGWYRKRTPHYTETDCGAATFIEANSPTRLFRLSAYEADIRANPDNPRYAPQIEWTGFDGPHPVDRGVGLPVDISSGWEFVPPVISAGLAAGQPYKEALEAAALQNEAFAQGHVAVIFCVAPPDLEDAPIGGICAQHPLNELDIAWWFMFGPMLVVIAGILKTLKKDREFVRSMLMLCAWLIYLWITAAQCSQGTTIMVNSEVGLLSLLLVSTACFCMCNMPCCNHRR